MRPRAIQIESNTHLQRDPRGLNRSGYHELWVEVQTAGPKIRSLDSPVQGHLCMAALNPNIRRLVTAERSESGKNPND